MDPKDNGLRVPRRIMGQKVKKGKKGGGKKKKKWDNKNFLKLIISLVFYAWEEGQ